MDNWSPGRPDVGSGGGSWILGDLMALVKELQRSGWIVHAAQLTPAGGGGTSREGLFLLTEETGGLLVENTNDLTAGLADVLERTALTYVLTFQVENVPVDGAFHPLRIELVDRPRGTRVIHRAGYHAPSAEPDPYQWRVAAATRPPRGTGTRSSAPGARQRGTERTTTTRWAAAASAPRDPTAAGARRRRPSAARGRPAPRPGRRRRGTR